MITLPPNDAWLPPHYRRRAFYTLSEIAEICSLSMTNVRRSVDNGYLAAAKYGHQLRVMHAELVRFAEAMANGEYAGKAVARVPDKYRPKKDDED